MGKIIPVIMSGGEGARLWPLSTAEKPKQFNSLISERSLLQQTAARFATDMFYPPVFIGNQKHADIIREQTQDLGIDIGTIIIEPDGRNTAACAIIAAEYARSYDPNAMVLLAPSDHYITEPRAFRRHIAAAAPVSNEGYIVTFGMKVTRPEIGYGYIKKGSLLKPGSFKVDEFVEKPALEDAQSYYATGDFYWNSGIFLYEPAMMLGEIEKFEPKLTKFAKLSFSEATKSNSTITLKRKHFIKCKSIPIDKALMEKTDRAAVVPADIGWSDVGSFESLHAHLKGENGNALEGDVFVHETTNSLVRSDGMAVAVVGLDDVAVIVNNGAVMVSSLKASNSIKEVVTLMKQKGRTDIL